MSLQGVIKLTSVIDVVNDNFRIFDRFRYLYQIDGQVD